MVVTSPDACEPPSSVAAVWFLLSPDEAFPFAPESPPQPARTVLAVMAAARPKLIVLLHFIIHILLLFFYNSPLLCVEVYEFFLNPSLRRS